MKNGITPEYVKRFNAGSLKLFNEGDISHLEADFAPDFVRYMPFAEPVRGPEGMANHVHIMRATYPDLKLSILETVCDGEAIVTHWRIEGTDLGESPLHPGPPTGRKVSFTGIGITHVKEGKIVEQVEYYDTLGVMQQLGLIPQMTP